MATPEDRSGDANPVGSRSPHHDRVAQSPASLLVPAASRQEPQQQQQQQQQHRSASASTVSAKKAAPTSPALTTTSTVLKPASRSASREASPTRIQPPKSVSSTAKLTRSRKNSQDLSPHRPAPTPTLPDAPSVAAVQRALSAQGTPRRASPAPGDAAGDAQRQPPRASRSQAASTSHTIANTGRVKSPLRSGPAKVAVPTRKPDAATSTPEISINSQQTSFFDGVDQDEAVKRSGLKSPSRPVGGGTTLEAVQESAAPETPAIEGVSTAPASRSRNTSQGKEQEVVPQQDAKQGLTSTESESEGSASKKAEVAQAQDESMKSSQSSSASKPASLQARKSFSQLSMATGKTGGDGSVRSMTVETETVSSVPQLSVGGNTTDRPGGSRSEGGGTVRVKPSTETIRPKKERKKPTRKAAATAGGESRYSLCRTHC